MHTLRSTGPAGPPRAASQRTWWPFALAGVVAAAAATWAARGPAAAPARPAGDGLPGELVSPRDPRAAALISRSRHRAEIARAVAGGQVNLLAAAAAYRDLAADDPEAVAALRRTFPGVSDDERYARAVVHRVRVELALDRADPAVADRLEAELRKHLTGGPLRLPTPTDAAPAGVVTPT